MGRIEIWERRFRDLELSRKMTVTFLAAALLIYGCVMAALQVTFRIYDRQLYARSQAELDFFAQRVNGELARIEALTAEVATGREVQDKLFQMEQLPYLSTDYNYAKKQLLTILQEQIFAQDVIKNVIYTDQDQVTFTAGTYTGQIHETVMAGLLDQFHEKRGGYVRLSPTEDYPYMLSGRDILETKNASLDYLGSLVFTSDIAGLIRQQADSLEAEHATLFVYSDQGMIYQDGDPSGLTLPAMTEERGWQVIHYGGERTFLCYEKSRETGWMYVDLFPYSEIYGQVLRLRYGVSAVMALIFACAILFLRRVAAAITRPLEELTVSMKVVEQGDFKGAKKLLSPEPGQDEAGRLSQEFAIMLTKIDEMIYENYEKQLLIKDTRYKMLQSQINPHFLYNTLNSLNWMVKGGDTAGASQMIIQLGSLLRGVLSKKAFVTAGEELAMLESYITIQQSRYKNRARFSVEREGCMEGYYVPKMILQPLVENAISYGVDRSMEVCQVRVRAVEQEEVLTFMVEDTGPGMVAQELKKVRDGTCVPKGHGIGLQNIRERLALLSADCRMTIDSTPGEGTKVCIRIPRIKEEPEHV